MASSTVDSQSPPHKGRRLESMPVIDLRLFSQSELYALSLSSNAAFDPRRCDDIVIPKIDRSVFNESAGSRKQTYSRIRLAPRKPESSIASGSHTPQLRDDPERADDSRIIKLLKDLMNEKELVSDLVECNDSVPQLPKVDEVRNVINVPNVVNAVMKRRRGRPRKNENHFSVVAPVVKEVETPAEAKVDKNKAARKDFVVDASVVNMDRHILNRDGNAVNLEELGNSEDPYGPELRRRTAGLATEEELLTFLKGFNGQWASRRKKKRIIEASEFGDMLPKGWKLVLAIKRKSGRVWLFCRRYISPSGRQFVLCKDISSYLCHIQSLLSSNKGISSTIVNNSQMRSSTEAGDRVIQENANCVIQENANCVVQENASCVVQENASCVVQENASCVVQENANHVIQENTNCVVQENENHFVQENKHDEISIVSDILNDNVSQETAKDINIQEAQPLEVFNCDKCTLTFIEKDDLLQHQLSSHRKKRSRSGESVTDGVIIKSGKFECQYCHKTFNERNQYNGHMGAHIRHDPKSGDALPACLLDQNQDDSLPPSGIISEFNMQELTAENVGCTADASAKIDEVSISLKVDLIDGSCVGEPLDVLSLKDQGFDCDKSEGNLAQENHSEQEKGNKASEVSIGIENEEVITESFNPPDSANEKIYDFSISGGESSKVPKQEACFRDIASHGNDDACNTKNVVEGEIENLITEADNQVKFYIASTSGGGSSKVPNQDAGLRDIASHVNDELSNTKNVIEDEMDNLLTKTDKQVKFYIASHFRGEGSKLPNQEANFHDIASHGNDNTSNTKNIVEDEDKNLITGADKQINLRVHNLSNHLVGSDVNPVNQIDKQASPDCGSIASTTIDQFSNHANAGNMSYYTPDSEGLKENRECGGYDVESNINNLNVKPMAGFGIGDAENQVEAVTKCAENPNAHLFDSSLKVDERVAEDNRNNANTLFAVRESGPSNYLENNLPFLPSYKQTFDSTNEQTELVFGINHGEQRMQERSMEYCSIVSSDLNIFQSKDNLAQQDMVFDTGLFARAAEQTSNNNDVNAMRLNDVRKSSNSNLILSFGNNDNAEMATNYLRDFSVGQAFNSENDLGTGMEQKHENCLLGLIAHDHLACDAGNNLNSMYKHGIWEEPGNDVGHGKLMMGFGNSSCHMQQSHDDGHEKLMMGFGSSSSSHRQQSHHHDLAAGDFWRTGILADSSSSQKQQCSSFFPTFSTFPDKVENESSLALNMSHRGMSGGFEVQEPARAEQVEFSFLTNHQNLNSLPDESSKTLAPYFESGEQSFNNPPPFWLEKDTLSLNITAPNMVNTLCIWCRNQFQFNPVQLGMQAGMMGSVCPTCSARISEQFL